MLQDLDKNELIKMVIRLENENRELKEKIYGKVIEDELHKESKHISNDEKVKIFMDIFKGRNDLYAKRWTVIKLENLDIHQHVKMNLIFINVIRLK